MPKPLTAATLAKHCYACDGASTKEVTVDSVIAGGRIRLAACDECEPASHIETNVALCDVCQVRPGTHAVRAAGIETWACDVCTDVSQFMAPAATARKS